MIDKQAFHKLSYGMFVVTAQEAGKAAGCVANTFQQVTSSPLQVSVTLNKENVTTGVVERSGRFAASCLSEDATMELIGTFGFKSSDDIDKFSDVATAQDAAGVPVVTEGCCAWFSAKVVQKLDLGTHVLFIGEVEEAHAVEGAAAPMTYAYYHQVKGGKTPPKASSYLGNLPASEQPEPAKAAEPAAAQADSGAAGAADAKPKYAWRCTVCGYIEYVEDLPDDFVCPICGVGKEMFERIEL